MDELLTQLGVGGIFAIVIIREVFNFMGSKPKKNGQYVNRAEYEQHKKSVQYKDTCGQIMQRLDERHAAQEKQYDRIDRQLEQLKTLIKNGHGDT